MVVNEFEGLEADIDAGGTDSAVKDAEIRTLLTSYWKDLIEDCLKKEIQTKGKNYYY